jgi:hypothetical protein
MRVMIPIVFFNGLSLGFINGFYTVAVIAPTMGPNYNGYVLAAFYLSNTMAT